MPEVNFDIKAAHRYFAADCFNKTWSLINKPDRTPAEDEQMIRLSLASHWHWTQREDYNSEKASIGYWQAARVYTLVGRLDEARRYAQLCLETSREPGVEPVFLGYAYEAMARVEITAGNRAKADEYLQAARRAAETVTDDEDKQQLLNDLNTVQ